MSRIFVVTGKTSSGKDTVFKRIIEDEELALSTLVSYTTRPMRPGEADGREYFFKTIPEFDRMYAEGKIIEHRIYHTVLGDWYYFTSDDGQVDLEKYNYLLVMDLGGFEKLRDFYGKDKVVPILIDADGFDRLYRYLLREKQQEKPRYDEVCRRYLADEKDFSEEKIERLGIRKRFINDDLNACVAEVKEYIKSFLTNSNSK